MKNKEQIIKTNESQNTEFKSSWHDEYLKWICGFANAIGGIIYIGMDDSGKVVGLSDYAKLMEDLPNKIRNTMGIICDVQLHEKDSKKFICIQVNPYSVPVSLRGRFYYRSGSIKMELTGVELNEFLIKKAGKTWDDMVEENATIMDIDETSIIQFIKDSIDKGRLPETKGLSTFQFLEKLKLTEGKKLKRAAIIMFGKDPMYFYPNIQVKIGRFGVDAADLRFHEIIEGNLVHIYHEAQVQINHKFLIRPITFEGYQRIEHDLYPPEALREMLLNALVHRTYMGATIQMRVYDDRLSIWNEGTLPFDLSLEDLKKEHSSRPRNPLLANACFLGGYIDTWGRGTLKIINACREAGLNEPEIIEKNGGVSITLFNHSISTKTNISVGKTSVKRRESVGKTASKILDICQKNPSITIPELALKIAVTERSIERNIQKLQQNGLLCRRGARKEGFWDVII
ncbi:MAG: putative DNA binding domain-containing protein [Spirochaetales bacterium]|nr:putative DNA binding domain-containing protein [Spirochaetales bacterium]